MHLPLLRKRGHVLKKVDRRRFGQISIWEGFIMVARLLERHWKEQSVCLCIWSGCSSSDRTISLWLPRQNLFFLLCANIEPIGSNGVWSCENLPHCQCAILLACPVSLFDHHSVVATLPSFLVDIGDSSFPGTEFSPAAVTAAAEVRDLILAGGAAFFCVAGLSKSKSWRIAGASALFIALGFALLQRVYLN
jgi:hypothetical protein